MISARSYISQVPGVIKSGRNKDKHFTIGERKLLRNGRGGLQNKPRNEKGQQEVSYKGDHCRISATFPGRVILDLVQNHHHLNWLSCKPLSAKPKTTKTLKQRQSEPIPLPRHGRSGAIHASVDRSNRESKTEPHHS